MNERDIIKEYQLCELIPWKAAIEYVTDSPDRWVSRQALCAAICNVDYLTPSTDDPLKPSEVNDLVKAAIRLHHPGTTTGILESDGKWVRLNRVSSARRDGP